MNNNWPSHVTKTSHLASRQNRPRLCLHFRIIKRASNWPKRTLVGHFLRLRQAGPQNASNSIFKCKQCNLLDNSPHSKEAHQTRIKGQLTQQTKKPPSYARKMWDRQSTWSIAMTSFAPEEFAPEEFFGGTKFVTMNYRQKISRMSISTALWKRSLTNAIKIHKCFPSLWILFT